VVVHVDQAGDHDAVARVDDAPVPPGPVRLDGGDPMPLDDHVHVGRQPPRHAVPQPAGADHDAAAGSAVCPAQ
jgi:hypothetical protein